MKLDKKLIDNFADITSMAAIACHKHVGKNDKIIADKAATDSMRKNLNKLNINGEIVIGEGELDEAPMLYIGEKLGTKNQASAIATAIHYELITAEECLPGV